MSTAPDRSTEPQRLADDHRAARGESAACHPVDQARLLHELQVQKVEMEMQNEALKQAHAALEESHKRYQDLYEISPVGYLTLSSTGQIAEINGTGAALFGIDRASLIERNFSDFLSPEDNQYWQLFFKALANHDCNQNIELRLLRQDLGTLDLRVDCLAVQRAPGDFVVHVAMTDISARKHAENRLREQEHLFRIIAERLDGFVAVLNVEGRRVYNSPSYERLLGPQNGIGSDCFSEVHPEDCERVRQAFAETVASGVGQHLEYRFLTPDGGIRVMESRGGVAWDDNGQIKYVVVVSNDVTERKEAERKIHNLAFYDSLTKLPNRLTLTDRLQQAMAASKRSGRYGALMFLDLDHFKPLNDAHGHVVGDQLLIQTGQRIVDCVRETDTVARFGGDEFVVVLGELDVDLAESLANAGLIAEKVRAAIAEPYALEKLAKGQAAQLITHHCTASIGVVLFLNHEQSEEEVLKLADIAMYQAKDRGRDGIYFAGGDS